MKIFILVLVLATGDPDEAITVSIVTPSEEVCDAMLELTYDTHRVRISDDEWNELPITEMKCHEEPPAKIHV